MSEQREQSIPTVLYPLYAARLYLDKDPVYTGHVDVTIINGTKVSFGCHLHQGDKYTNVTSSVYIIDFSMFIKLVIKSMGTEGETSHHLSVSTSYGGVKKESDLKLVRDDKGIWTLVIQASGKPTIKFPFKGIRGTILSSKGSPIEIARVSVEHLAAWIDLLSTSTATAALLHAADNKRILPPKGGSVDVTS